MKGKLIKWNSDRGFGFIKAPGVKKDIFIHISELKKMSRKPAVNDTIIFDLLQESEGKNRAINAAIEGVAVKTKPRPRKKQPARASSAYPALSTLFKILIAIAIGYQAYHFILPELATLLPTSHATTQDTNNEQILAQAFKEGLSNIQVKGAGKTIRILPDDEEGSRHQKFIIKLRNGQTILIAHNIDIAPKVSNLKVGDRVQFQGEYEWNAKGGVVHWTHHDPGGSHDDGWLKHHGQIYQ